MELTDAATRTVYSTDNSIYQVAPAAVFVPGSSSEIADRLSANHALGDPMPVVARGAGTGTNGQSLTDGLMIDIKRRMHSIRAIDADARLAVVDPGVVAGELNAELAPLGLHWAPHTSTLSRCTVGGMISTDAAGKGSLVHGRTHRHVASVDLLLDDGSRFVAEPVTIAEAERRASEPGRSAATWRALLELPVDEASSFELPELARGFSGYGIDRFRRDGLLDPLALVVGSEGTLGVITSATLRLTPLATHTRLVVASYTSFADALTDAVELRTTAPAAIETFDEQTLEAGRASPAWPALGQVVGDHAGSVLLLEYEGDEPPDLAPVLTALDATGRSTGRAVLDDASARADAWKVRADAVGLVAKVEVGAPLKSARPTAMVEDCAVPVASMVDFIADFRAVLDGFGVRYAMFGHADVGCVHVRPALDTTDPEDERLVRAITDAVVDVVAAHGGVLWGEHGRGFRGESVETFLSPSTIEVMRHVKSAFDPNDRFNPGKLYRPVGVPSAVARLDEPQLRGQLNRAVPVQVRNDFSSAFACNGNGLCHHHGASEVMCPSYKATRDPALSPKGRADLMREWLRRGEVSGAGTDAFADDLADNLAQCLSCSACTGRCPVEVDIPELKSRFLERYYESRRRPMSQRVLGRFEGLALTAARAPRLAGLGAAAAGRLLGLVDLPVPTRRARPEAKRFDPETDLDVDLVVLQDLFTSVLDPRTLEATCRVLQSQGWTVRVAEFVGSGKYDHVKGSRKRFRHAVERQQKLIESIVRAGARPVAIEPATALLHAHEYPAVSSTYPGAAVSDVADVVLERIDRIAPCADAVGPIALLGHCTERATRPASLRSWVQALSALGYDVSAPALGCCGMAGIFGHEKEQQDLSWAVWKTSWAEAVQAPSRSVATGYSCRSQARRFGGAELQHPIHVLDELIERKRAAG